MRATRSRFIFYLLVLSGLLASVLGSAAFAIPARADILVVTSTADSGTGSLRQAVLEAAPGDTITFSVSGTITLTSQIQISKNLTITGPGAANLTINGGGATRLFYIDPATVNLSGLTFANGHSGGANGGAIFNFGGVLAVDHVTFQNNQAPTGLGGAIYKNQGGLAISNSTFDGGSASFGGAIMATDSSLAIANSYFANNTAENWGGGVYMDPGSDPSHTLLVLGSTFANNHAAQGAGINRVSAATDILANSTFSANTATGLGGGLYNDGVGILTATNNTFSGNSASQGGGLYNIGKMSLINNILANSPAGTDCSLVGGTWDVLSHNLIETGNCPFTTNLDPVLDTLSNNGGPTPTFALLPGSPALDAGDDAACDSPPVNNLDQRGVSRPLDGDGDGTATCDMGAFEVLEPSETIITGDNPDPSQIGESVNVKVSVTGPVGNPSGTVVISGADTNCNITLLAGTGSCEVTFQSPGSKTLTATYAGDATHLASQDTENHAVDLLSSTTTITSNTPNPSRPGALVTVTYTVVASVPGGEIPAGNVTVSDGVDSCNGTVAAGTCAVGLTTSGVRTLTATYAGDSNFNGSSDTQAHTVDGTPPQVGGITRADPSPTNAASVNFIVNFSEAVTGVDMTDFNLTSTGSLTGVAVSGVTGLGATYTVTVNTGSGSGTLRLDVVDDDSILDSANNPLGGGYNHGEVYDIRYYPLRLPLIMNLFSGGG